MARFFRRTLERVKGAWQRTRGPAVEHEQRGTSRRELLKAVVVATTAAALEGCTSVVPETPQEKSIRKQILELLLMDPILTEIRKGKSVRMVLEGWPNIQNREMGFAKGKGVPGRVTAVGYDRKLDSVSMYYPSTIRVRSDLHTHTYSSVAPHEMIVAWSRLSVVDALALMKEVKPDQHGPGDFRAAHIAIISADGKVMGYYSMRLGKKLYGNANWRKSGNMIKTSKYWGAIARLKELNERYEHPQGEELIQEQREYTAILDTLKSLGLQIRVTSLPGYRYENGYFQAK